MIRKRVIITTIFLFILLILIYLLANPLLQTMYPQNYKDYVEKYAKKYEVDPNLVFALVKAESNFQEDAVSNKGARGLMQLMENTAKDVIKKTEVTIKNNEVADKLLEPEINICLGTKYLAILMEKYQNIEIALTAYNAGIGTVDTWIEKGILQEDGSNIEKIPYKETNQYVRKILRDYQIYQELY